MPQVLSLVETSVRDLIMTEELNWENIFVRNRTLNLSYLKLPLELVDLCKLNMSEASSKEILYSNTIRRPHVYHILSNAFKQIDDGRGPEKIIVGLGWINLRDRMGCLYLSKFLFEYYPHHFQMELLEEIKLFEAKYSDFGVDGFSRLFLLGFYMKIHNQKMLMLDLGENSFLEFSDLLIPVLKLSKVKSEKLDWLLIILQHFLNFLGFEKLKDLISENKKFVQIYEMLSSDERKMMHSNLLAYSSSVFDSEFFLYEKV